MGIILAIFIFAGTFPVSNDLFIKILIGIYRAGFKVFKNFELKPSRPELLLEFSDVMIRDTTSGSVGNMNIDR